MLTLKHVKKTNAPAGKRHCQHAPEQRRAKLVINMRASESVGPETRKPKAQGNTHRPNNPPAGEWSGAYSVSRGDVSAAYW